MKDIPPPSKHLVLMDNRIEEGEEKKCESPEHLAKSKGLVDEIEFEDDLEEFGEDTELVPLTDELKDVFGERKFQTEEALHDFMDQERIADFRVILVGEALYLRMPTDQHNDFTSSVCFKFAKRHGDYGYVTGTHNVHLSVAKEYKRKEPDVSFFGAPRCVPDEDGDLVPYNKGAVPDVVLQFSWRNARGYQEDAIDDMMSYAVETERGPATLTHPRVGYLIKVRFKRKRTLPNALKGNKTQDIGGLDVYRLPRGTTVDDAINGNNGASKFTYTPDDSDQNQTIDINPQDLGFTQPVAWNGYQILVSRLFNEMNAYNKDRQRQGLAT